VAFSTEKIAAEFLELASEQRLNIIQNLAKENYTISRMAKELDATVPEVHRNFSRLIKSGFIAKNVDGTYDLTVFGNTVCQQIPWIVFLSSNKKYFTEHNYGEMPQKFVHRIGELSNSKIINGYVRVLETWNNIYKNAEKYIYNILVEVSYNSDLVETLIEKLENNIKIQSIFSEYAIISEGRSKAFEEKNFKKFIIDETLKRKMKKDVKIIVVLNENEAAVCFPSSNNEVDLSKMFYSKDPYFHEWCLDYFDYSWKKSGSFQEGKLNP
jgi:predicted transcriptional regulator